MSKLPLSLKELAEEIEYVASLMHDALCVICERSSGFDKQECFVVMTAIKSYRD